MTGTVFFRGGGFEVNEKFLRTPRRTYFLANVEYISVTRPLLLFAGAPAFGIIGFVAVFFHYLYLGEIALMLAASTIAITVALMFGTLRVHSLALRDDEVAQSFGPIARLRRVRAAVEQAMEQRIDREAFE
jgi:hypothetical protein